jgi:hypothetical protein
MEQLNEELDKLIDKLEHSIDFRNDLESVNSVYPFSRYEYIISTLLAKDILSYEDYLELRESYINRNLFLYVFEISAPRGFGVSRSGKTGQRHKWKKLLYNAIKERDEEALYEQKTEKESRPGIQGKSSFGSIERKPDHR